MLISFYIEIPDCSRNYFWIVVSFLFSIKNDIL